VLLVSHERRGLRVRGACREADRRRITERVGADSPVGAGIGPAEEHRELLAVVSRANGDLGDGAAAHRRHDHLLLEGVRGLRYGGPGGVDGAREDAVANEDDAQVIRLG
jgi:hypothetical protein